MNIDKIKRRKNGDRKKILINIRVSKRLSDWLREKDYSPTGIFYEALKELGYDDKEVNNG
jgi:hypothetical protein